MTTPEEVVTEARRWIGTPFAHGQRQRGRGSDCLGLLVGVARGLGLVAPGFDTLPYGRLPRAGRLLAGLERHLVPWPVEPVPGVVAAIRFRTDQEQHVGVIGEGPGYLTLIHVHSALAGGVCVEHRYAGYFRSLTTAFFAFPGVTYVVR